MVLEISPPLATPVLTRVHPVVPQPLVLLTWSIANAFLPLAVDIFGRQMVYTMFSLRKHHQDFNPLFSLKAKKTTTQTQLFGGMSATYLAVLHHSLKSDVVCSD